MSRALGEPLLADELQRAPLSHRRTVVVTLRRMLDDHPRVGLMLHPSKFLKAWSSPLRTRPIAGAVTVISTLLL